MDRQQAQAVPKPFIWVRVSPRPPRREPAPSHERLASLSGRLELEIEVVSEFLHVGSGSLGLTGDGRPYCAFARLSGDLVLPGSGIKGPVRSIAEAISNSCISQCTHLEARRYMSHMPCRTVRSGSGREAALCPACRLFGAAGYRGRVFFSDATPIGPVRTQVVQIGELWSPKVTRGRKFYENKRAVRSSETAEVNYRFVEAVPNGTRFAGAMFFENVAPAELGLLMHALGLALGSDGSVQSRFPVKIGGGRPRCLGGVHLRPVRVRLLHGHGRLPIESIRCASPPQPADSLVVGWLRHRQMLDQDAWTSLADSARPRGESCPEGVY